MEFAIESVRVGERHRHDLGDVAALARSIEEVGLLHPVVVTPDRRLVAGMRRLEACRHLGMGEVPVTIVDLDDLARGEHEENAVRKAFLPSEVDAICRALEPAESDAAHSRKKAGLKQNRDRGGNFPQRDGLGKVRDRVAAYAGVSGRTLDKLGCRRWFSREHPARLLGREFERGLRSETRSPGRPMAGADRPEVSHLNGSSICGAKSRRREPGPLI